MIHQAAISTRNEFGPLLNALGLKGTAVEIGVHRGDFANILLSSWQGERFVGIDPWTSSRDYDEQEKHLPERGATREDDYSAAFNALKKYGSRWHLLRDYSVPASKGFDYRSVDFIYIDGDHRKEAIITDLQAWWPKLNYGGIIALHDWLCPGEPGGGWGKYVQAALDEFIAWLKGSGESCITAADGFRSDDVFLIVEENGLPWTAYLRKT